MPDGAVFRSFFRSRSSVICAATLLVEIGDSRARYPHRDAIAADGGQAPVAVESDKRKNARFRWACNKRQRNALGILAQATRFWHPWAADRYTEPANAASIKNRVHALLARQGILPEHTDLFGKAGREYLTNLQLPDGPRRRLDSLIALISDFDREITDTTTQIDQRAKADERVRLLCQIRGIGPYTALLIIAEIGEVKRFPTAKHLCRWAGLTPTVRSSDGKARLGHISRQGSAILRWALCEAAQHAPTGGGPLRAQYERIAKRRGPKIARVAVARQILTLCYSGLRDGEIRCLTKHPAENDLEKAA